MKRTMLTALTVVLSLLAAGIYLLYQRQEGMIYFPRPYDPGSLDPRSATPVRMTTSQGAQTAWWIGARSGEPTAIWVLFGGNGTLAREWSGFAGRFPDSSAAFLLVDYPGYGLCEGKPSPGTILESTRAAFESVCKDQGIDPRTPGVPVNLLGHSLGAAAALQFGAVQRTDRIILVAPFTSMTEMAERTVGSLLARLLRHRFDNLQMLRQIQRQTPRPSVVVLHGDADTVIPVDMGRTLAAAFPDWIRYAEIPGADHNSLVSSHEPEIMRLMMQGVR